MPPKSCLRSTHKKTMIIKHVRFNEELQTREIESREPKLSYPVIIRMETPFNSRYSKRRNSCFESVVQNVIKTDIQ
jgi:hypothetical protein